MKFTSLFSSSKGNCLYVEDKNTKVLIDAGLSGKAIENETKKVGISLSEIDALLITHEHIDHINAAGILNRRYRIPLYMTEKTYLACKDKLGNISDLNVIDKDKPFSINDIEFTAFEIPHDAADPVGYMFDDGIKKGIVATDMGMVMDSVLHYINRCEFVFLEANHDVEMLKNGPYPINLKKRILSPFGHLSNIDAGKVCASAINSKAKKIMLGHLSEQNNTDEVAYDAIENVLLQSGIDINCDIQIDVANRYCASKVSEI